MKTREIARGGMLAAAAFALIYLGSAAPWAAAAGCIAAGAANAVPLVRHPRMHQAVLIYAAVSVLSLLFAPRKSVALGYTLFCGLYPVLKYLIECRVPCRAQTAVKLAYFDLALVTALLLMRAGLFPAFEKPEGMPLIAGCIAANFVFLLYDIGLSRLIATLRRLLPPS